MRSVEVAGDLYEIGLSENGIANRLGRYNKNHGIHISLCFTDTENPDLLENIKNDLKHIFVSEIKAFTDKN